MRFDSEFFWTNPSYDIIYNHLLNGIHQHQGVMALTGEAGTGKTFLLRELMQAADTDIQFIFYNYFSNLDFDDLLAVVCGELGLIPQAPSRAYKLKALTDYLNNCFYKGITIALLIDEAHNLDEDVVNHLVSLSKSGFKDGRSLQIILSGLPLLGEKLRYWKTLHPIMSDVLENRLEPLTPTEVAAFVRHQLQIAGATDMDLFPEPVLTSIAHHVRVPRLINMFCDRALQMAQAANETRISPAMIDEVANEVLLSEPKSHEHHEPTSILFIPPTPPKPQLRESSVNRFFQTEAQTADHSDRTIAAVSLDKTDVTEEIKINVTEEIKTDVTEQTEKRFVIHFRQSFVAESIGDTEQRPWRRHIQIGGVLLLLISIGVAGSYALQRGFGSDMIPDEARQMLELINHRWSSLSSEITSFALAQKAEPPQPPTAPENIPQDVQPPPGTSAIPKTAAEVQPAVALPEATTTDLHLISQTEPEPDAELVDTANLVETPVQFEEVSGVARQTLEAIRAGWSSTTSRMLVKAQTLNADTHLPPSTPVIIQNTPPVLAASAINEPATLQVQQENLPEPNIAEPGIDPPFESQTEPAAELVDMPVVVETPLDDPVETNELSGVPNKAEPSSASPSKLATYVSTALDEKEASAETAPAIEEIQTVSASPETLASYMRKGDELFELSDLASARLYYETAANAGHPAAMVAVGKTYDPLVVRSLAIRGTHADPLKAAEWYQKAFQAGAAEAAERLEALQHWMTKTPPLDEADRIALQQLLQR